ncbi:AsmA-like C-terminal region-containing protein [Hymenobacter sp. CRA2]|uniref:AsmA family protein n=1 Tax=Hymenobacter sp. CRA2 TaxID=1955620 RepID=UPI00098EBC69|nr:AsmA-like C-terminal region-containing protein [Hymenobacter sp. CRA2]OON65870.1 hypothetical protein B0919_22845 [Hymenobacter sp. CRA2]
MLILGILGVVLLGAGVLGTRYGRRYLEQQLRQHLAANSDLRVSPLQVRLSWRDFPYLTAQLQPLTFTDTAYRRAEPVLQLGRVDARLALGSLLRGRVRVTRLVVHGATLRTYVDGRGRRWTLHGRRRSGPGQPPAFTFELDAIRLHNVRLAFRNDYKGSAFAAQIHEAQLRAGLHGDELRLSGQLSGLVDSLHNRSGEVLGRRPVQAWVHYRYAFSRRQGTFWRTRATLNGDTIHVAGTHTTAVAEPAGSILRLRFEGEQALMGVLRTALPPSFEPFLHGARSPSKAHIRYTISGLSSPTVLPRNVLRFQLRRARLLWPDSTRRINHWDLLAVLDNGPAHSSRTTSLTLQRCRIYSPMGELNLRATVRNFDHPSIIGELRGRTDLPALAALVAPGAWRAERGRATLDVRLRGLLLTAANQTPAEMAGRLSLRGSVTLQDANFELLSRRAHVRNLNVRLGLRDSLWQLTDLSGQVAGMRFRASARTLYLLEYLTGRRPATQITGSLAADELRVAELGQLLRPSRPAVPRNQRRSSSPDTTLLPSGLRLNLGLQCARLVLPADTLYEVAMHVARDAQRTRLSKVSARMWGGLMQGQAAWPVPSRRTLEPPTFRLALRFGNVDYLRVIRLLAHPDSRVPRRAGSPRATANQRSSLAVRELLLAANGQATCQINSLRLPVGENLRHVRLQVSKTGAQLRMPALYFATSTGGGAGFAQATARVVEGRLAAASANLDLRYATVDVQRLLLALASLQPPEEKEAIRRRAAGEKPGSGRASALLRNDLLTARLHVRAEHVRYGALTGTGFRLTSQLRPGEARLDECVLRAFGGEVSLRGRLQTDAPDGHHPVHVQALLTNIALPRLFEVADALRLEVLGSDNVRGTMRCQADLYSDLGPDFLPAIERTRGYAQASIQDLELRNVTALEQALKFIGEHRTSHLYFRPVNTQFFLDGPRLLVPQLLLNSNLTDMEISGEYYLTGRSNLYVGLNPVQALLGNNRKRTARIRENQPNRRPDRHLLYVNLHRPDGGTRYAVRLFKRGEKKQQQAALYQEYRQLLRRQPVDTTLLLLRQ